MASALELLAGLERFGIRLGLDHLRDLDAALGSPERAYPTAIVAGTNGKGSVAALLSSIAEAAGARVGLYTSPHLEAVEERIRANGETISAPALGDLLQEVLAAAARLGHASPTYFEAMTLAALLHFARVGVDLAVLEVGMGGRLDATNLADAELAVVTAIDFDHQEWLGRTLAAIAREKAGVMRRASPAVLAPQQPEALAALLDEAAARGAEAIEVSAEVVGLEVEFRGLAGLDLLVLTRRRRYELSCALAGRHQAWNVATAVVAAERLSDSVLPGIDPAAIAAGVASCRWPGRLESFRLTSAETTLLLDAAHNPAGCAALAAFLVELDCPFTLLFGGLADKDLPEMLPVVARRAREVVLTRPPSARAADPAELARLLPASAAVTVVPEIEAALARALAPAPGLVVACGSIFLVGALRTLLRNSGFVSAG